VVGAGGIGSLLVLGLSKLGIKKIELWDADVVSPHNLPNQFFKVSDIGRLKVEAIRDLTKEIAEDVEIDFRAKMWEGEELEGIVVSAVDSMEVRKKIFQAIKMNSGVPIFVDGRIGGQVIKVLMIDPSNIDECDRYEKTLDGKPVELPCNARAVFDVGFFVGAMLTRAIRIWITTGEKIFQATMDVRNLNLIKD